MKNTIEKRPTEVVTGIALAGAIYGFLTQAGVGTGIAAVVAVCIAFVPGAISNVVDQIRSS